MAPFLQLLATIAVFSGMAGVMFLGYWLTGWATRRAGLEEGEPGDQWGYSAGSGGY